MDKVENGASGAGGKTVGVKVSDDLYAMLREVQEKKNLKSIKASLLFCAIVGAKTFLGRM
jgi:hypothetical protein